MKYQIFWKENEEGAQEMRSYESNFFYSNSVIEFTSHISSSSVFVKYTLIELV